REREGDKLLLAKTFLDRMSKKSGRLFSGFSESASAEIDAYGWPGNVRELENCMHRSFLMCSHGEIKPEHLGIGGLSTTASACNEQKSDVQAGMSIRNMERALIEQTLEHVQGNRTEAAKLLGISIRTLRNKLKEYQGEAAASVAA
ncbi:MAG: helix-turn-helix domain-containing protein, partial [Ghiorsea sp.]|nr:helix-turn-helix domain-containing protein [Ghiorsea sp.]